PFDRDAAARAIDTHASDAGDPGRHIALLAERGCNAEPDILRRVAAPPDLLGDPGEHRGLPVRAADRAWRPSCVTPGAIEQPQPKRHRIDAGGVGGLIYEALQPPVDPARPDRA